MTQKSITPRAWFELFLLGLLWGASFLTTRIALDEIGPLTVVLHRTGWAALILWGWVWLRGIAVPLSPRLILAFAVMGILNNVIPFGLMAWAQLYIESGLTAIFNAATAIWGVALSALVFRDERLTWNRSLGVSLGFFGVCVAVGLSSFASLDLKSLAQLAVLAGTLSYAFGGIWARIMLTGVSPHVAAAGMLTASTIVMVPLVVFYEGVPTLALQADTWAAIAYFSVMATAVAYLLYYRVLGMAGSGNLMLCTLLVAPVAIILGALVLGEVLPPRAFIGFAILGVGLLLIDGRVFKRFKKP